MIKDLNGNVLDNCPRCHSEWKAGAPYFNFKTYNCSNKNNCLMTARNVLLFSLNGECVLELKLIVLYNKIYIEWYNNYCSILVCSCGKQNTHCVCVSSRTRVDLLPYDITCEQLKVYLTFS